MCFSLTASFTAAAVLAPLSIYSIYKGWKIKPFILFGFIPLFFAVQQAAEGVVWLALDLGDYGLMQTSAYIYLFFAYVLWPFYFPLCTAVMENSSAKKKVAEAGITQAMKIKLNMLKILVFIGFLFSLYLYIPIVVNPDTLQINVVNDSIQYVNTNFEPEFKHFLIGLFYAFISFGSLMLSSNNRVRLMGLFGAIAAAIAISFYYYAYTSVWCFFAAIFSIYIPFFLIRMPQRR